MNKNGLLSGILLLIIGAAIMGFYFDLPLQADSGWDTDYSGGSSSSSSSWGGSNDSWSSYDGRSSSSGSGGGFELGDGIYFFALTCFAVGGLCVLLISKNIINMSFSFVAFPIFLIVQIFIIVYLIGNHFDLLVSLDTICLKIMLIIVIAFILVGIYKIISSKLKKIMLKRTLDNKVKILGCDSQNKLKKILYKIFEDVQMAWMDFDYDRLKELCSDTLFESYKSDLEVLKLKNGKNIMKNFKINSIDIIDIVERNDRYNIILNLYVSFYDYVIDSKTEKVIRGSKWNKVHNTYKLTYYYYKNNMKCPNCGADLSSNDCKYCHTHIDDFSRSILLAEKKKI